MNTRSETDKSFLPVYRRTYSKYRRAYTRLGMEVSAQVSRDGVVEKPAEVKDVSVRGMKIVLNLPLSVGERISIAVRSSYIRNPVQKNVKVRWCREVEKGLWEAGVEFDVHRTIQLA
ncbi:MAG: PilZ domain-containing protein [Candidatus Omnitrophica bacterium]|nr:PilZ domain-containing protein [Candidatus Omnitrophota bacterium]